jgi:hypothetical protein
MAAYTKTLVVLANSCKNTGRCLAGKEVKGGRFGAWVRPTSARPGGELTFFEQRLAGGAQPSLLDVVDVPLAGPAPAGFQAENHRTAPSVGWQKHGQLDARLLRGAVDDCPALWINGYSSGGGVNDRVPEHRLGELTTSLYLIGPLSVDLRAMGAKVRARFVYRHVVHNLSVTDPRIKEAYAALPHGWYRRDQVFLSVSLAPPFYGYAYKLAAAIIMPNAS